MTDFTPHSGDKQSTIDSGRKMCRILNFWDLYMVSQSKALLSASEPLQQQLKPAKKGLINLSTVYCWGGQAITTMWGASLISWFIKTHEYHIIVISTYKSDKLINHSYWSSAHQLSDFKKKRGPTV